MKKIILLPTIITLVMAFLSCEEERLIYDNKNSQSFIKFEETSASLPVPLVETATVAVPVSISTISDSDRTISVSVVEEETTLDASNYSVPLTMIIPASSYTGTLEIIGTNTNLILGEIETLTLKIDGLSAGDFSVSSNTLSVLVFLNCDYDPLSFVGTYEANEAGYCDGCYMVDISYDDSTELFELINLYDTSGVTYIALDYTNSVATVDFRSDITTGFGVLWETDDYGPAYAVDPSEYSEEPDDDISYFRTCDNFLDLTFRPRVEAGFYDLANVQLTKL